MDRGIFLEYLKQNGCHKVRDAKRGYSVFRRNDDRSCICGVPANDPLRPATVCSICASLRVPPPDMFQKNGLPELISQIHKNPPIQKPKS